MSKEKLDWILINIPFVWLVPFVGNLVLKVIAFSLKVFAFLKEWRRTASTMRLWSICVFLALALFSFGFFVGAGWENWKMLCYCVLVLTLTWADMFVYVKVVSDGSERP